MTRTKPEMTWKATVAYHLCWTVGRVTVSAFCEDGCLQKQFQYGYFSFHSKRGVPLCCGSGSVLPVMEGRIRS